MVRVSMEVRQGSVSFTVSVQAESIQRARAVAGSCYPGGDVRVVFPIEPESFFVRDGLAGRIEPVERLAG